jgi:putative addiction module component (TIGR02574 family)
MNDTEVLSAALRLPARKRERVAEALLESVKSPSKKHLDRLWTQESEARIDAFLAGKIKTVSGEKVLSYRIGK